MRFHLLAAGALVVGVAAVAATTDTTPPASKPVTTKKTTVPVRVPTHVTPRSTPRASAGRPAASRQSAPPHQAGPTPERYKEIQESLISKGYLEGSASGVWDQSSMDAMRKYQTDQKLEPTGKITAKALINLGLGPKDESAPPTTK
jgi:hypothetical protein